MNSNSRRDFLKRIGFEIQIKVRPIKKLLSDEKSEWLVAARIADLEPGKKIQFIRGNKNVCVKSSPDGVMSYDQSERHYALRFNRQGALEINFSVLWPKNRVLSHASGEAIDLRDISLGE